MMLIQLLVKGAPVVDKINAALHIIYFITDSTGNWTVMHIWSEFWSKTNIDVDFLDFVTVLTDFKIVHGERLTHSYDFK